MTASWPRAEKLMEAGPARLRNRYPLTIRLAGKDVRQLEREAPGAMVNLDPGSETAGAALVRVCQPNAVDDGLLRCRPLRPLRRHR